MAKQMMFSQEARQQILEGLSKLTDAVKVTMGPTGRNVILQKSFGSPRVTKDGVSVSKEVDLPQPFENMGAKLINQVASKTSDEVGDGTTAATVLAEAIFREGFKAVTSGANPQAIGLPQQAEHGLLLKAPDGLDGAPGTDGQEGAAGTAKAGRARSQRHTLGCNFLDDHRDRPLFFLMAP